MKTFTKLFFLTAVSFLFLFLSETNCQGELPKFNIQKRKLLFNGERIRGVEKIDSIIRLQNDAEFLSPQTQGVYFINIKSKSGITSTKKFIVIE